MDTYVACTWVASLVALLFGVFKCRSFAEVLFGLSETDAQLELQEKHYEKIKRKSLYWIAFLGINKNLQIMGKNVVHLFLGLFLFYNPLILIFRIAFGWPYRGFLPNVHRFRRVRYSAIFVRYPCPFYHLCIGLAISVLGDGFMQKVQNYEQDPNSYYKGKYKITNLDAA